MTASLPQPLRSDALDNRERILDAARELFSADGLDVPMREIARRAGVGPATLYRRFPAKQDLVTEAFADQLRACRRIVDEGCADDDPWRGLCGVIEQICELHARDRGFTEAFMSTFPGTTDMAEGRTYTLKAVAGLAERAKAARRLRGDFVLDDLVIMIMANKGIRAASPEARVRASRRFAGYVIQAFAAGPVRAPLPPATRLAAGGQDDGRKGTDERHGEDAPP
ncbi:TetR/AcrR family transcriptional regulator [uncultured Streptomyces sp.]|uniref:TetR/AcrR family transcriptional regulator n=1 Tax=uncultured Streptomyces sp. TaxID=174707 RepID=UPI00260A6B53|nr:TetR/AcrR family transcriptional regulator [uncultured Streptomyces sp.]